MVFGYIFLFFLCGTPYPTINNKDLVGKLKSGYRMGKSDNCTQPLCVLLFCCFVVFLFLHIVSLYIWSSFLFLTVFIFYSMVTWLSISDRTNSLGYCNSTCGACWMWRVQTYLTDSLCSGTCTLSCTGSFIITRSNAASVLNLFIKTDLQINISQGR